MSACAKGTTASVSVYRKRDRTIKVTILKPEDITGAKVWFSVKTEITDTDLAAVITKRNALNDGTDGQAKIVDGPGGVIEIYLKPADTQNLEPIEYWWDLVIETTAGKKIQVVSPSKFQILMPVTIA